jgi:hypothetical protein
MLTAIYKTTSYHVAGYSAGRIDFPIGRRET